MQSTQIPCHAVPNGGGEIENDHRKIMSPTTILFDFRRTSFSNLAVPIDSNVAAGPSSIRIKHTSVVAEQATSRSHPCRAPKSLTRFPLAAPAAPPSHAVACDSHAVPNGGGEIENDHRKIVSPTTMLFDFFRTSFSNLAGPFDSNVAAGPSSIRMQHAFVVADQATSGRHPWRALGDRKKLCEVWRPCRIRLSDWLRTIGKARVELRTRRSDLRSELSFVSCMSHKRESAIHRANTKRRLIFSLHHRESDALQVGHQLAMSLTKRSVRMDRLLRRPGFNDTCGTLSFRAVVEPVDPDGSTLLHKGTTVVF
jgi:hypothetical protein